MKIGLVAILFLLGPCLSFGQVSDVVSCLREHKLDHCRARNESLTLEQIKALSSWEMFKRSSYVKLDTTFTGDVEDEEVYILNEILEATYLFKKEQQEDEKAFQRLMTIVNGEPIKKYPVLYCEALKKIIGFALENTLDSMVALRNLSRHKSVAYDDLELSWNEYYRLSHTLNLSSFNEETLVEINEQPWLDLINHCKDKNYRWLLANVYFSFAGYSSYFKDKYDVATNLFYQALDLSKELDAGFYNDMKFSCLGNIGFMYLDEEKYEQALNIFQEFTEEEMKYRRPWNQALYYRWVADCYKNLGNVDTSYFLLEKSYDQQNEADRMNFASSILDTEERYKNQVLEQENREKTLRIKNNNYLIGILTSVMLGIAAIYFFSRKIFRQRRLLLETELENQRAKNQIEKLQALEHERNRIATEMHDDLGSGLTTIKFLTEKSIRKAETPKQEENLLKVLMKTKGLVRNLSEIIWAMNSGFDSLENLVSYTRRYSLEFLEDHEIEWEFKSNGDLKPYHLSGEKRRSIFLVIKEALHNAVKHADATFIIIAFNLVHDTLYINIKDNGKGLGTEIPYGNGIQNMKNRMKSVGGTVTLKNDKGLMVVLSIPLKKLI